MQDFFNALLNSSVIGALIYQENGQIVFVNKRLCEILSLKSENELIGKSILEYVSEEEKEAVKKIIERRMSGEMFALESKDYSIMAKNSVLIPVSTFSYTIEHNAKPSGLMLIFDRTKEVSNQKLFFALSQINRIIAKADNVFDLLKETADTLIDKIGYKACSVGYIDKDNLLKVLYLKPDTQDYQRLAKTVKIGVDPNTPYGKGTISKAYHTKKVSLINNVDTDPSLSYWHDYFKMFKIGSVCSIPVLKSNKVEYIISLYDSVPNSFSPEYMHLLEEISLDLSFALEKIEMQAEKDRLFEKSTRDELTYLYNRYYFNLTATQEFLKATRYGYPLSVAFLDIDNFKQVNDTYGHHIGDLVLRDFADAIVSQIRRSDMAFRYGGEEFVILFSHATLKDALSVVQRIKESLSKKDGLSVLDKKIRYTFSAGIACLEQEKDIYELVEKADKKMYEAKQKGKDRIEL